MPAVDGSMLICAKNAKMPIDRMSGNQLDLMKGRENSIRRWTCSANSPVWRAAKNGQFFCAVHGYHRDWTRLDSSRGHESTGRLRIGGQPAAGSLG